MFVKYCKGGSLRDRQYDTCSRSDKIKVIGARDLEYDVQRV